MSEQQWIERKGERRKGLEHRWDGGYTAVYSAWLNTDRRQPNSDRRQQVDGAVNAVYSYRPERDLPRPQDTRQPEAQPVEAKGARQWLNTRLGKEWSGTLNGEPAHGIFLDPRGFPDSWTVTLSIKELDEMLTEHAAHVTAELQDRIDVLEESTIALAQCGREWADKCAALTAECERHI